MTNQPKEAAGQERYEVKHIMSFYLIVKPGEVQAACTAYDPETAEIVCNALNNRPAESELVESIADIQNYEGKDYEEEMREIVPRILAALDGVNTTQGDSSDK
jgi:hypothetical protein